MEKRTPHCPLERVRLLLRQGRFGMTREASRSAALMGLHSRDVIEVVQALCPGDFHKSMTTYADHRTWQDVCRPRTAIGRVYLKLMVVEGVLIVSFKEL